MTLQEECEDEDAQTLNLSHNWLTSFMPFLMGKIDRVSFGLLTPEQLVKATHLTKSRELCAIPFVGKDVPSPAAEFSHPDVVSVAEKAPAFGGSFT